MALGCALMTVACTCAQALYNQISYAQTKFESYSYLCFFSESFLTLALPLWLLGEVILHPRSAPQSIRLWWRETVLPLVFNKRHRHPATTIALYIFLLSSLNFLSSWTWLVSLSYISITANQALFSTLCGFVLVLSAISGTEKITICKLVSVIAASIGSILLFLSPEASPLASMITQSSADLDSSLISSASSSVGSSSVDVKAWIWGCTLVIFSTLTYALYEIFYSKYIGLRDSRSILLSQTGMGVVVLLFGLPFVFLMEQGLHYEPIPPSFSDSWVLLMGNAFFVIWYDVVFAFGITAGQPTYISLLIVPLSVLTAALLDLFWGTKKLPSLMTVIGICLLISGSVASTIATMFNKMVPFLDADLIHLLFHNKKSKDHTVSSPSLPSSQPPQSITINSTEEGGLETPSLAEGTERAPLITNTKSNR